MLGKVLIESEDIYHADKEHLSASQLKQLDISPAHFKAYLKHGIKTTDAMDKGKFLHSLGLEQDIEKFVARPLKDGSLVRSNSKEYKEFLESNPGKTPIAPDLFDSAYEFLESFTQNKIAMELLSGSKIEHSVYAMDHESGFKIKARPDIWKGGMIADLKTTSSLQNVALFERSIFSFKYDLQLAHYAETIFQATGEMITDFYILAVETSAPFGTRIFKFSKKDIEAAKQKRRELLNLLSVCKEENTWPTYTQEIIEVIKPKFMNEVSLFEEVV